jgi:hypothetical protein
MCIVWERTVLEHDGTVSLCIVSSECRDGGRDGNDELVGMCVQCGILWIGWSSVHGVFGGIIQVEHGIGRLRMHWMSEWDVCDWEWVDGGGDVHLQCWVCSWE